MILILLSALAVAQTPDPAPWIALPGSDDATYAYRLHEDDAGGDVRRLILRATPVEPREFAHGELIYEMDCSVRTMTILSVRSTDAEGAELQAVTVPEDRRTADPMYADAGISVLYAALCPGGAPLPEPPAPLPPPISTAPRR